MEDSLNLLYKIGREPEGDFIYKIPASYQGVSRTHAILQKEGDDFILQDKSSNGTIINDLRIKKAILSPEDKIILGTANNGFGIDAIDLIKNYNQELINRKLDFSEEFQDLKKVYEAYDIDKNKIIKRSKINGILPRIILSVAMIVAIYFFPIPPDLKYPLIMGVGILGMALSVMSKSDQAMKKKLEDLIIQYNRKYVCPKCHNKLNIQSKSYNMLLEDGKCPYKKCDAIYRTELSEE